MNDIDERDLLSRELHRRSHAVGGHPIDFDTIRAGARRVQRRRTALRSAVAAVVAAIAIPSAFALNTGLTTAEGPDDKPSFAGSPSAPPAPRPSGPVRLTLDGIDRGEDAGVDYLTGNELVRADGNVVGLPKAYREIAPYAGGWVALASTDGELTRDLLDVDGSVTSSAPATWGIAVDRDRSQVAYTEVVDRRLMLVDAPTDGGDPRTIAPPDDGQVHPVGYAPAGALVYSGEGWVRVVEPSAEERLLPGLIGADGVSGATGLVAGQTKSMIDGSCNAVVDYRTGVPTVETCKHSFRGFNPDGTLVIGTDAYGDGNGDRSLAVLDARSGEVLVQFEQGRDGRLVIGEMVWEDDQHVLAPVGEGRDWRVVRFGLDGSMEVASDTVSTPEFEEPSPILFAAQP